MTRARAEKSTKTAPITSAKAHNFANAIQPSTPTLGSLWYQNNIGNVLGWSKKKLNVLLYVFFEFYCRTPWFPRFGYLRKRVEILNFDGHLILLQHRKNRRPISAETGHLILFFWGLNSFSTNPLSSICKKVRIFLLGQPIFAEAGRLFFPAATKNKRPT